MSEQTSLSTDLQGLDLAVFTPWFDQACPDARDGDLRGATIAGGRSNLTYEVTDGSRWWIVRRPPLGHVQATAHDMGREYAVISALADTEVPVPRTWAQCTDPEVIGAPFYVMDRVPGRPLRTEEELVELGEERTRRCGEVMVDVLARLHAVDPTEVGLAEFGRPEGFLERQVRRWGKQLDGSRSRDLPDAEELHRRLSGSVPEQGPTGIVHGDYRLDNLLVTVDPEPQVQAVVDWEMATLGDPLTDVALLMVYDRLADLDSSGSVTSASRAAGFPSRSEQLDRYAAQSGRDLSDIDFHLGLAHFKLAVILEGIYYRHSQGMTVGGGYEHIGEVVEPLLAAGLESLRAP